MTALATRPYQDEAITAVENAWADGTNRPAVVLPTGTGKTVMFAHLAHREVRSTGQRALILVHRDELVTQTAAKLHGVDPELTVGVVKAERNETDAEVIVASVQTLSRKRRMRRFLDETYGEQSVGTVIVDEAHHAAANSYRFVLEQLGCFSEQGTRTLGVTATLARTDSRGLGDVWHEVVYTRSILWAIGNEYLVDVRGKAVTLDGLDLGSVARSHGDYADGSLADALLAIGAGKHIATAYREQAGDRQGIMFCPNVETAYEFAGDLCDAGITAEVIIGTTPSDVRRAIYREFERREVQVLVSCAVLTEGFDMPQAEVCVIARPTQSAPLFVQMVGRVLRPFPGKRDALVLDVVGASAEHGLATLVDLAHEHIKGEMLPGESVIECIERTTGDERVKLAAHKAGKLTAADVDLFARSRSAWLKTPGGVWFIPTRDAMFFLWPSQAEGFRVGRKGKSGVAELLGDEFDLDLAMSWAEQYAASEDPSVSSRAAAWRQRRMPPSPQQLGFASQLGFTFGDDASRTQVSDAISIELASRTFDRHL